MAKSIHNEMRPPWLIRMENGSIGEARTRAFLIDRFWILERSVDIDGADFIIQRRMFYKNLLDKKPPILGVVQVKFFESESTTQYLHKEYVLDPGSSVRNEFFLMCHTGKEDNLSSYLLSANDINTNFRLTGQNHSKPNCFVIPGATILRSSKFKVISKVVALDRIEKALIHADFIKNRQFLSWRFPESLEMNKAVNPIYCEPLDNWYCDIPKEFIELKKKALRAIFEIEEALNMLNVILNTDDPEKALEAAEEIYHCYRGSVPIPNDLFDEDFLAVVKEHKEHHAELFDAGLLDSFLKFQSECKQFICSDLPQYMDNDMNGETAYMLTIFYDFDQFTKWNFSSALRNVEGMFKKESDEFGSYPDVPSGNGIFSSSQGSIVAYILAGRYCYKKLKGGKWIDEPEKIWEEKLETIAQITTREIMYQLYHERFGE